MLHHTVCWFEKTERAEIELELKDPLNYAYAIWDKLPIPNDLLSGQVYSCICCQACDGRQQTVAPSSGRSWSRAETRNYFLCRDPTRLQPQYVSVWWCTPVTDQPIHNNSTGLPNIYLFWTFWKKNLWNLFLWHVFTIQGSLLLCFLSFKIWIVHNF